MTVIKNQKNLKSAGGSMANFTKKAIKASFLKLLNEQPLGKISVRDIVEDCGINRNSFYYHFSDIQALLSEIITEQTEAIIQKYPSVNSLEECFELSFKLAKENKKAVIHIYESADRDIFTRSAMKLCENTVTSYINTAFKNEEIKPADKRILISFVKCLIYGMCIDWISSGMQDEALDDLQRAIDLCQGVPEHIIERSKILG